MAPLGCAARRARARRAGDALSGQRPIARRAARWATAALAALTVGACAADPPAQAAPQPYLLVLGTAQDGGKPQIGCFDPCCEAARADPSRRRRVASLLVVDPASGGRWLIDATPDLPEQVELARGHPPGRRQEGARPALFDGVFLTHAHVGHYTGLLHLGREAYGARGLPVYGTARMRQLLERNAPWSLLVETGAVELRPIADGESVELAPGLGLIALAVPHRDELSDTLAFVVRGPRRSVLYLPDIDQWERWERPLEEVLAGVDLALLDGTFFDAAELPGRDRSEFPHPTVESSLRRLSGAPPAERAKVLFTHLNHTNPAGDPDSDAAAAVRRAGMGVARDGQRLGL